LIGRPADPIIDDGIVGPAVPQRLDYSHELLGAGIAFRVAHLARIAEVAGCRGKPRRYDVPPDPAVADVIERRKLAREVERLGVSRRTGGDQPDLTRCHCHRREHRDGLKPATRGLRHVLAKCKLISEKDRVEQCSLCALRQIQIITDVGEGERCGRRVPPRCFMVAAAVDEQVEMQLPVHAPVL
jgi:hypothetical protein